MSGVTFRLLRDGDEPALLVLFRAAFGRWPTVATTVTPAEHLRWKLASAPLEDRYHCVAEEDGRIVAAHLCVVHPFRTRTGPAQALRTWDAAVLPDHQGRGLMTELRRFLHELAAPRADFEIAYFTRNPVMHQVLARAGQVALGPGFDTLIAPLTLSAAAATLKLRPGRAPAKLARSAAQLARWLPTRAARRSSVHAIRPASGFDTSVAEFTAHALAPFDYALERSPAFLNWRYADARAGAFAVTVVEEAGALAGYAVRRTTGGRAYLADLLALPDRPDIVEALARDALASFREEGATEVACLSSPTHPYRRILRSCGFIGRRRRKEPLTVIPLRATAEELAFLMQPSLRPHVMFGDSDTV